MPAVWFNLWLLSVLWCGHLAGATLAAVTAAEPIVLRASFRPDLVREAARHLAAAPFQPSPNTAPASLAAIGYDQWRDIRFKPERALWRGLHLGFEAQFFMASFLYREPVELFEVDDGTIVPIRPDRTAFDFGSLVSPLPADADIGYSGFRLHGPLNRSDVLDEIIVFQGASYFRAIGRHHSYGMSARGLALNTVSAVPEEFPRFRTFWIERPSSTGAIRVHALLDGPSIAGAYHMTIKPGLPTVIEIEANLYPRETLTNVGIAPLTSMFLFNGVNRARVHDFRSAVHDSEGLAILNGRAERLWRPLNKHRQTQVSAFVDENPRGFGLVQRQRDFKAYQDLEAHYERRPSTWVEPLGPWGKGAVELIELSTGREYDDNIVAFWRPAEPLQAGRSYQYRYRLSWSDDVPHFAARARVLATRAGAGATPDESLFVVDFEALPKPIGETSPKEPAVHPTPHLTASAGILLGHTLQMNPETGGYRLSFRFDPQNAPLSELRAELRRGDVVVSEAWLFRWTPDNVIAAAKPQPSAPETITLR